MYIFFQLVIILLGLIFAPLVGADLQPLDGNAFVSVSGAAFSYNDDSAVTSTNALVSLPGPVGCFGVDNNPGVGNAVCFSNDPTVGSPLIHSDARGDVNTPPNVGRTQTNISIDNSVAKSTFAAGAAFARAGGDVSVTGVLQGGTPFVDLGDIQLYATSDPLGSMYVFELDNQSPKNTGASRLLNNDILSQSFGGTSAKALLPLQGNGNLQNPGTIYYKLVLTLDSAGNFNIVEQDGTLFNGDGVTTSNFTATCRVGSDNVTCPEGQFGRHLSGKRITLNAIPASTPGGIDALTADQVQFVVTPSAVPEPSGLLLLGSGLLGVAGWRFIRRSQ